MSDTATIHKYTPEGYEEPTTVRDALIVGKAILQEEDRWIKGTLYDNPHPEVDPTTPFCNSWGVCALGAVAVATLGIRHQAGSECTCDSCKSGWEVNEWPATREREAFHLYREAAEELHRATRDLDIHDSYGTKLIYVTALNDRADSTLDQVLQAFDRAIENLS